MNNNIALIILIVANLALIPLGWYSHGATYVIGMSSGFLLVNFVQDQAKRRKIKQQRQIMFEKSEWHDTFRSN